MWVIWFCLDANRDSRDTQYGSGLLMEFRCSRRIGSDRQIRHCEFHSNVKGNLFNVSQALQWTIQFYGESVPPPVRRAQTQTDRCTVINVDWDICLHSSFFVSQFSQLSWILIVWTYLQKLEMLKRARAPRACQWNESFEFNVCQSGDWRSHCLTASLQCI